MKKYSAKINGSMYEIEIELVKENGMPGSFSGQPSLPPQAGGLAASKPVAPVPAPVKEETLNTGDGPEEQVTAPMPGTILSVHAKAGSAVKKGQVLLSLEAMKMENEIMASRDGIIVSVNVSAGAAVEAGSVLCVIK